MDHYYAIGVCHRLKPVLKLTKKQIDGREKITGDEPVEKAVGVWSGEIVDCDSQTLVRGEARTIKKLLRWIETSILKHEVEK